MLKDNLYTVLFLPYLDICIDRADLSSYLERLQRYGTCKISKLNIIQLKFFVG